MKLAQTMGYVVPPCISIMTTNQPHQFLRMHFMVVRATGILPWHRTWAAPIGDHVPFFPNFNTHV
jgi:hypothetical protein